MLYGGVSVPSETDADTDTDTDSEEEEAYGPKAEMYRCVGRNMEHQHRHGAWRGDP